MTTRERLNEAVGEWSGTNRLWLMPDDPARESRIEASIELVAGGAFASIRYTWEDEGRAHDGLLVVRNAPEPGPEDIFWVDSFHTAGGSMTFRGEADPDGRIVAVGSYAAPPGPDWGWRIALKTDADEGLRIVMHNITPDGQEALAVEAELTRSA